MTPSISLLHTDCRAFSWPEIDLIYTDPPYGDLDAYGWLGRMGAERLRPGGLALVYADMLRLPEQTRLLTAGGLKYAATFSITYPLAAGCRPVLGFIAGNVRHVVLLSQGKLRRPGRLVFAGRIQGRFKKRWHRWEQAVEPAAEWIGRLTRPNDLVADPFAGSGTTAAAVAQAGHPLRFLGTEIDGEANRSARRRLAGLGIEADMKVGDICCGVGGISEAFGRQGFSPAWACDVDLVARDTYQPVEKWAMPVVS